MRGFASQNFLSLGPFFFKEGRLSALIQFGFRMHHTYYTFLLPVYCLSLGGTVVSKGCHSSRGCWFESLAGAWVKQAVRMSECANWLNTGSRSPLGMGMQVVIIVGM